MVAGPFLSALNLAGTSEIRFFSPRMNGENHRISGRQS